MEGETASAKAPPQSVSSDAWRGLFAELRRRHVFRVAAAYGVAAWLFVQIASVVAPTFDFSEWVMKVVVVAAGVGFVAAASFAWMCDLSLLGLSRSGDPGAPAGDPSEAERCARRGLRRFTVAAAILAVLATASVVALRATGAGPFAPERSSLAVLPFADLSPGRDQAYFAEGVAEEILGVLADDPAIRVVGRTSSAQFKDRAADMGAIREALDVTHVLEGSVRTQDRRLRMSVRLIRTRDGGQVWAEEYDRDLQNVFAVQDEIGEAVAARLRGTLSGRKATPQTREVAVDAYALLLAARAKMRLRQEAPLLEAQKLAEQAIALEPDYAPAHAAYAEATRLLADDPSAYGRIPLVQARAQARPYAERAIRLASDRPEGYAALGLLLHPQVEAVEPLRRAISLDPERAELRIWLGITLENLGRNAEALEQHRAAYEIEPLWATAVSRVAWFLAASERFSEADAIVDRYARHARQPAEVARIRAAVALERGDLSEVVRHGREARRLNPSLTINNQILAIAYNALGLHREATALFPPGRQSMRRLVAADDHDAIVRAAREAGPRLRGVSGSGLAIGVLAARRHWPELVQLYDARFASPAALCAGEPYLAVPFALALRSGGRAQEAAALLACLEARAAAEMAATVFAPLRSRATLEFHRAQALAARGDAQGGLGALEQAVQRGWKSQDQVSSDLADYPAFDPIRNHPRFSAVEAELRRELERERREVLALNAATIVTREAP